MQETASFNSEITYFINKVDLALMERYQFTCKIHVALVVRLLSFISKVSLALMKRYQFSLARYPSFSSEVTSFSNEVKKKKV